MDDASETLTAAFALKAKPDAEGRFVGLASTFGNVDSFNERVARGAFRATLAAHRKAGRMPAMLWSHDTRDPIGVWEDLRETERGLEAEGRLILDVQRGREAHAMLKAGAIDGLSIGFRTVKSEVDEKTGIRTLIEVELLEVSLVTFPANDRARVTAVKAAIDGGQVPTKTDFERMFREAGLSKAQAKAFVAAGYSGFLDRCPAIDDASLLAAIDQAGQALGTGAWRENERT